MLSDEDWPNLPIAPRDQEEKKSLDSAVDEEGHQQEPIIGEQQRVSRRGSISNVSSDKDIRRQITRLIQTFAETTAFWECRDDEGNTKPCCIAAKAFLAGAAQAASAQNGIAGILDVLETKFTWGIARCWTVCQCFEQSEIDCGSNMNVAVLTLSQAPQVVSGEVSVLRVQVVQRWNPFQAQQRRSMYDEYDYSSENLEFLTSWIDEDVCYHQCVGFVACADDGRLRIWDSGKWILPPSYASQDRATCAIRLSKGHGAMPPIVDWGGLDIPTGSWYTLLPEAIPGFRNIEPLQSLLKQEEQLAILERIFDSSHQKPLTQPSKNHYPICESRLERLTPTIIVSGTHMSQNPCPGVGVARGIRSRFPLANILAIDGAQDVLTGMMDVTFDGSTAYDVVMMPNLRGKSVQQHWRLIVDQLKRLPEAFYIPTTDSEIDRCASAMVKASSTELELLHGRLLCPPDTALDATKKPAIIGAKSMGIFEIPSFMSLDAEKHSQTDIETFCKREGYPVFVKGPIHGATVCHSWQQVHAAIGSKWGSGGYVQKVIPGFQLGLAFCAYEGELTAAVLMEATAFNAESKAWAGQFRPCPPRLFEAVRLFCADSNWSGGAEIEFIEDMSGRWHAIDWNPRFPAWVFGATYAGVNLPASLIQHALHTRSNGMVPYPEADSLAGEHAGGGFTRTVVEVPILNTQQVARSGISSFATSNCSKAGEIFHAGPPLDMLPPGVGIGCDTDSMDIGDRIGSKPETRCHDEVSADLEDRKTLTTEINRLIPTKPVEDIQTPKFLLSRETVREQLVGHRQAIQNAIDRLDFPLKLQMCLSVKTQPHAMVLEEAQKAGYYGEVITTAEMRACLEAGWKGNEIVMNGPGKWYDTPAGQSGAFSPTRLRCLFADSLADLETIVNRVVNSDDWLEADFVGVRFAPVWVARSRFGLDSKDPRVLREASDLIKRLPKGQAFGLHMHFACSTVGPTQWFGLAKGFLEVSRGFADLCEREPTLLDFGGGWPASLLDCPDIVSYMTELLSVAQTKFPALEVVQLEPGKSITERAGAIVTKVLEIREVDRKTPRSKSQARSDDDDSDDDSVDEAHYAAIVDACISDMGSVPTHVHPLLWKSEHSDWKTVTAGKDQLWGSICMEFDILGSNICLPESASPGDLVLIAFCGAYDMTMSYEFADGKGRNLQVT